MEIGFATGPGLYATGASRATSGSRVARNRSNSAVSSDEQQHEEERVEVRRVARLLGPSTASSGDDADVDDSA